MINSKLLVLLRRLDANEFKELEKFVASPYHASGRDFVPLFKILKPFYPEFNDKELDRQNLFGKLYPSEKYSPETSDHKIRMIFSAMFKLSVDFLVHNEFNRDVRLKQYFLLNQLRLKKMYKEFENMYAETSRRDLILDNEKGGLADFLRKHFLDVVLGNCANDRNDFHKLFEYTIASGEKVVIGALMECFKFECMRNLFKSYGYSPGYTILENLAEVSNLEKFIDDMKKNNDPYYLNILIFYTAYKMNRNKDKPEYFYELKRLMMENGNLFGRILNYNFWQILMAYYASVDLPIEEIFSMYDHILENKIYSTTPEEDFNIMLFKQIVCTATAAGRSKWLENFIKEYSNELNFMHKENMHNFSYAHLNFSQGKFEEALKFANKIDFDVFGFKMDVRILLFKIYFELFYYEQAYSLIHSTFNFLKSTREFSESKKDTHLTVFKHFKELLKLKTSNEAPAYAVSSFGKKLMETNFQERKWVMEKIGEMGIES